MNRIAVIHAGAIGDLIQTLPTLAAVRRRWPAASITLIARPERAALARLAGTVDACVDIESCGLWRFFGDAPAGAPLPPALAETDLVLDFLTGGALERYMAGGMSPVVTFAPLPPAEWDRPAAEWINRQAAERLGLAEFPPTPEIPVPAAAIEAARGLLAARGIGGAFIAIHPGSGSLKKNWPIERFVEIARRLRRDRDRPIVWLAGPAELERGTLGGVGDAIGDLALDQVAAVLAAADGYVGNDSGVTQIASAVRRPDGGATPVLTLFGPTDARIWSPRGSHVRVLRAEDGRMESIDVEAAWDEVRHIN